MTGLATRHSSSEPKSHDEDHTYKENGSSISTHNAPVRRCLLVLVWRSLASPVLVGVLNECTLLFVHGSR